MFCYLLSCPSSPTRPPPSDGTSAVGSHLCRRASLGVPGGTHARGIAPSSRLALTRMSGPAPVATGLKSHQHPHTTTDIKTIVFHRLSQRRVERDGESYRHTPEPADKASLLYIIIAFLQARASEIAHLHDLALTNVFENIGN